MSGTETEPGYLHYSQVRNITLQRVEEELTGKSSEENYFEELNEDEYYEDEKQEAAVRAVRSAWARIREEKMRNRSPEARSQRGKNIAAAKALRKQMRIEQGLITPKPPKEPKPPKPPKKPKVIVVKVYEKRTMTPEHKAKLAAAIAAGHERRRQMLKEQGITRLRKPMSEETKQKIAARNKERAAERAARKQKGEE